MTPLEAFTALCALAITLVALAALAFLAWHAGAAAWREYHAKKRRPGYLLDRPRLGIDPTTRRRK